MKRRHFLGIACVATAFANACKSDEPTPETTIQGYITDSQGRPVVGLEVIYMGQTLRIPGPDAMFWEQTLTNEKGFFQIFKVIPGGIDADNTKIYLSTAVYQKYKTIEATKNGVKVGQDTLIDGGFNIKLATVNEYLITLK